MRGPVYGFHSVGQPRTCSVVHRTQALPVCQLGARSWKYKGEGDPAPASGTPGSAEGGVTYELMGHFGVSVVRVARGANLPLALLEERGGPPVCGLWEYSLGRPEPSLSPVSPGGSPQREPPSGPPGTGASTVWENLSVRRAWEPRLWHLLAWSFQVTRLCASVSLCVRRGVRICFGKTISDVAGGAAPRGHTASPPPAPRLPVSPRLWLFPPSFQMAVAVLSGRMRTQPHARLTADFPVAASKQKKAALIPRTCL